MAVFLKFTEPPFRARLPEACGVAALLNIDGQPVSGQRVVRMLEVMRERENGLGAGFAAYGIFPEELKGYYCLQLMLEEVEGMGPALERVEEFLKARVEVVRGEEVRVNKNVFEEHPKIHRFFVDAPHEDVVKDLVMGINTRLRGAFCLSSGKDMAVFKGCGWSDQVARFYRIEEIEAFMWLAHSRFPTNTPGWWGGAHPFSILGHSVVHNGEITSYGTNVNYLKEMGYECALLTDTEVIAYLFDFLVRKCPYPKGIAHRIAAFVLAPSYWREIDGMSPKLRRFATALRVVHRSAMANGPFSVAIATDTPEHALIGHSDRKKLRPLIAALSEGGETFYLASELSAIHRVDSTPNYWQPDPGKPVIAALEKGVICDGTKNPLEGIELA